MTGPIIIALDRDEKKSALDLLDRVNAGQARIKIGKEIFTRFGPAFVEEVMAKGFEVFLDLKFHDIPNTVFGACRSASALGVWMMNVHASGGKPMMQAAKEALIKSDSQSLLVSVTILTSLSAREIHEIGYSGTVTENVANLARLTKQCGLDGVVCSPLEIADIRQQLGEKFVIVTPGIRPKNTDMADQKRVMNPKEALDAGADYLVIGRPITSAPDPQRALEEIMASIA